MTPYKFKDDGSHIISPLQRKIYFIIGIIFISHPIINYFVLDIIDPMTIIAAGLAGVMIWGINRNGFYKIVRWYMERKLRQSDNKWR